MTCRVDTVPPRSLPRAPAASQRGIPPSATLAGWIALFVLLGCAALAIDVPLARLGAHRRGPEELNELLDRSEIFGHAYGAVAICVTVMLLDTGRRREAWRLLAGSLGAGLAADAVKLLIPRLRPAAFDLARSVGESFLLPPWGARPGSWHDLLDSRHQSCPSAHTAVAVALACGLAWLYPSARWWFALLAALCGLNRVVSGAHFASDVLWGIAVGILVAALAFRCGRDGRRPAPPGTPLRMGHHKGACSNPSAAPSP